MKLPQSTEYIFYTLYSLEIVLSVAGNVVVLFVLTFGQKCRNEIRPYLINLAIGDLMMAVFCLPATVEYVVTVVWKLPAFMCPFILFLQNTSVAASVYTNVAISIDRLMAVKYPFSRRLRHHQIWALATVWIASVGFSAIELWVSKVEIINNGTYICREDWPDDTGEQSYTIACLLILILFPGILLLVLYSIISKHLWVSTLPGSEEDPRNVTKLRARRKVF